MLLPEVEVIARRSGPRPCAGTDCGHTWPPAIAMVKTSANVDHRADRAGTSISLEGLYASGPGGGAGQMLSALAAKASAGASVAAMLRGQCLGWQQLRSKAR